MNAKDEWQNNVKTKDLGCRTEWQIKPRGQHVVYVGFGTSTASQPVKREAEGGEETKG